MARRVEVGDFFCIVGDVQVRDVVEVTYHRCRREAPNPQAGSSFEVRTPGQSESETWLMEQPVVEHHFLVPLRVLGDGVGIAFDGVPTGLAQPVEEDLFLTLRVE